MKTTASQKSFHYQSNLQRKGQFCIFLGLEHWNNTRHWARVILSYNIL